MPTKNEPIDLSNGTLYIKHPDGHTEPLGKVTEIYTEPTTEPEALPKYITLNNNAGEITLEIDAAAFIAYQAQESIRWAALHRAKLLHLAQYAKTKKARRKNAHRILREYIEEVYHVHV